MATRTPPRPRPSKPAIVFYEKLWAELAEGKFSADEKGKVTYSFDNLFELARAVNHAAIAAGNV